MNRDLQWGDAPTIYADDRGTSAAHYQASTGSGSSVNSWLCARHDYMISMWTAWSVGGVVAAVFFNPAYCFMGHDGQRRLVE